MPEMKHKTFNSIVKSIDEKNYTLNAIISSDSPDRHMEIVLPSAFKKRIKKYMEHPVLISSHVSYSDLRKNIGKVLKIKINEKDVEAKIQYFVGEGNDEADWAWNLAKKGIAAFSIGFMSWGIEEIPKEKVEKIGANLKFTDIEMFELSQVIVPANRDALQERSAKNESDKELCELVIKNFTDDELKQFKREKSLTVADVEAIIETKLNRMKEEIISESIKALRDAEFYSKLINGDRGESRNRNPDVDDDCVKDLVSQIKNVFKTHNKKEN